MRDMSEDEQREIGKGAEENVRWMGQMNGIRRADVFKIMPIIFRMGGQTLFYGFLTAGQLHDDQRMAFGEVCLNLCSCDVAGDYRQPFLPACQMQLRHAGGSDERGYAGLLSDRQACVTTAVEHVVHGGINARVAFHGHCHALSFPVSLRGFLIDVLVDGQGCIAPGLHGHHHRFHEFVYSGIADEPHGSGGFFSVGSTDARCQDEVGFLQCFPSFQCEQFRVSGP